MAIWIILILCIAAILAYFAYQAHERKLARQRYEARRAYLTSKYKEASIVELILSRSCWVGQTQEQLVDTLGNPVDIDQKVLKTKKKEIWKYFPRGANRFGLRVTLENDAVVGWDEKL